MNESELPIMYRNLSKPRQKLGFPNLPGDKQRGNLKDILSVPALGIKAAGLIWGMVTELEKPTDDVNQNSTSRKTVRPKVEKQQSVADEAVVVKK
jgi:hypothetical protein